MKYSIDIYENAEQELADMLRRVIFHCENNSSLVIGPRGSGKTHMIRNVMDKVLNEMKQKSCSDDLLIVYLSGCLQADDKSALWEICRQLRLENVVNDKVSGSFADNFEFLLKSIRAGTNESKPLIFIMDEFDLFTKNKTQLLLYTILNAIQTSSTPMCLIGTTCRIDILDLLEKRIKSRFAHRQIYLFKEYDVDKYIDIAKRYIEFDYEDAIAPAQTTASATGKSGTLGRSKSMKASSKSAFKASALINSQIMSAFVNEAFEDPCIRRMMRQIFNYDKSLSMLKRFTILPTVRLTDFGADDLMNAEQREISMKMFKDELRNSFDLVTLDTKTSLLNGLSILELTLVVCMLLLSESFVGEPFNFELIYTAYLKFLHKSNLNQQKYEKQIILKAYEHLIFLKCVLPATEYLTHNKMGKINKEYALMYLALDRDEIDECLVKYPNCPTELRYYRSM